MIPYISGIFNLTNEPETRQLPSGSSVTTYPLAANNSRKTDQGKWESHETFYVRASGFDNQAGLSVTTGDSVYVYGYPVTNTWEDREGNRRSSVELKLRTITKIDWNARNNSSSVVKPSGNSDPWGSQSTGGNSISQETIDTPPF